VKVRGHHASRISGDENIREQSIKNEKARASVVY
jgi:hypothetical protein